MADYRAFILDFCEKADALLRRGTISEYNLFLQAFSDKVGNKLCCKCDINLDDPTMTTANMFAKLKKEALAMCANEDSQMRKLWKQVDRTQDSPTAKVDRDPSVSCGSLIACICVPEFH